MKLIQGDFFSIFKNVHVFRVFEFQFFFTGTIHADKCFVESTKIWLTQQSFSIKYESMEILFELTPKNIVDFFFFQFYQKHFESLTKKWN